MIHTGKKHLNVSVILNVIKVVFLQNICVNTLMKSHTHVLNVILDVQEKEI